MGFSDKQVRALGRNVPARAVRSRVSDGKELTYVEGWYVLAEANRIFGFDGWDRETVETKCLLAREVRGCAAVYSARVRITVRAHDRLVVRDGHGTGEAHGSSAGEVHDRALKAAETDATKRALATFGKAFGLALYAGARGRSAAHAVSPIRDSVRRDDEEVKPAGNGHAPAAASGAGVARNGAPAPAATARIDKSALTLAEPTRVRDKEHLRYVASQPCLLCSATPSDAHHVRFAQPRAMGRKVSDEFTVPLCRAHHHELHQSGNEAAWWHDMGIDPLEIAQQLWHEGAARGDRPPVEDNAH